MLKLRTNIFALRLAMSFQKAALSNLGGVEMHKGDFRAHLQFRDEEGTKTHVRGPPRATEREAYADLEAFRGPKWCLTGTPDGPMGVLRDRGDL